ncbi:hypothetical protein PHYBOEH_006774, partial [Phytophthora boehmeriae]
RFGASGGALLCPHMFDVWLLSVPTITWMFAGLLVSTVFGIVVPYGFGPAIDDGKFCAVSVHDSETDLEPSVNEEDHLVVNELDEHKIVALHNKVEGEVENKQVENEPSHSDMDVQQH